MKPEERLIISLDLEPHKALELVSRTPQGPSFKVGMKLFTSTGPNIVRKIQEHGFRVFLDLKFHDIPNTVADAAEEAANLGVWMFNIHTSGGPAMIRMVRERLDNWSQKTGRNTPILLGVTLLTSIDEEQMALIGLPGKPAETVINWTELAIKNGCNGVVCSPAEIKTLREHFGLDFIAVTPGIRRNSDALGDQKRVATPKSAINDGATHIVVGRPIITDLDPSQATLDFIKEIENV